jgi:hypothetical protein
MNSTNRRVYIVRGGSHSGQYIAARRKPTTTGRKYAWDKNRRRVLVLTYEQARGVARRYGGQVVHA